MTTPCGEKMDILKYVNSRAVREHLRKTGYRFSGFKAAWLVWNCRSATLAQKRAAWELILGEYPDEVYPNRQPKDLRPAPELHAALRRYMALEEEAVRFVQREETGGWIWRYRFRESAAGRQSSHGGVFASFQAARASGLGLIEDLKEKGASLRLEKLPTDGRESGVTLDLNAEGDLLRADPFGLARLQKDPEKEEAALFFEDLWFAFPTPFQKGDLVRDPHTSVQNTCVLEETAAEFASRRGRPLYDGTDMVAYGIFPTPFGTFFRDVLPDYTSLEPVSPEELSGRDQALIPLSRYLKGEIDLSLLVSSVRFCALAEDLREERRFSPEDLALSELPVFDPAKPKRKSK